MTRILLCCALVLLAASCGTGAETVSEEEGPGAGPFTGTFADALWTVIAFAVLAVVLGAVAWKPLLRGLNARSSLIERQLKQAETSRRRAEHLGEDYKQQGHTTVLQAAEQAQRHYQRILEQTREEVLALRQRAHEEIENARAAAVEDLWKQTGEIVLRVGSEVLGRALNPQDNQRLIDEAVARIRQDGGL